MKIPATRLSSPRFVCYLLAQFLGAANDNAFKITLALFILGSIPDESAQLRLSILATLLFPLPFLIFSPLAGFLADRFRKSRVIVLAKAPEIAAMALAVIFLGRGSLPFLFVVLTLMATQSAFFSPVKFGLLPEICANRDLSLANGILEMTTNLAILIGSVSGVFLYDLFRDDLDKAGWIYLCVAIAGLLLAMFVPLTPRGNRGAPFAWNVLATVRDDWREAKRNPALIHTLFGIAYFGFLGSVFLAVIPVFGKNVLDLSEKGAGLMLMVLSVGIAAGSVGAGRMSRGKVEVGLVPLGSIGLTLFATDLVFSGHEGWGTMAGLPVRTVADLFLLGLFAGLYIVPLNSLLQQKSPDGMKGRMVAFSNVITFSAVMVAAMFSLFLTVLGFDSGNIIIGAAALTLLATIYIVHLLPDSLVRLVLLFMTNLLYRIEVVGDENIPRGGALLVANHVSWIDSFLVGAATDRMVRFLMYRPYYEARMLNWFFRRMHVIPVAAGDSRRQREESLALARQQIDQGHVVCIFAEGAITRTGNLLKFKRGFERIAAGMSAPIIPVFLDGVWGSIFSWERGKLLFKRPTRFLEPVRVVIGKHMAPDSGSFEVRRAVQELSVEAFRLRSGRRSTLAAEFTATVRRFWRRPFLADSSGVRFRFGQAFLRALAMRGDLFGRRTGCSGRVGILMPPGCAGALANLSALAAGRVVVNLDGESGGNAVRREVEAAGLDLVVTSKRYLAELGIAGTLGDTATVDVEDALARLRRSVLAFMWACCRLLPGFLIRRLFLWGDTGDVDGPAAVVFSSRFGKDAGPHGVVLSHGNIISNLESLKQVFRVSRSDRILGVLPLSSSFGLVGLVLLPAIAGVRVFFHPDASDLAKIGDLAGEYSLTILPVHPSHLEAYVDSIPVSSFGSLRHVVVAGGMMSDELRVRFNDKFGVEPLQGFGCAECAPLIAMNVPSFARGKERQEGHRPGTSGHPLPGIAVKVVDPRSGDVLPPGRNGRLMVKGSNVMMGYLDRPEDTAGVLRDGWYDTGYKARLDADGFITVA